MIDKALEILKDEIQGFLKINPDLNIGNQEKVYVCNIAEDDGSIEIPSESLGITLVNIEEERITKVQNHTVTRNNVVTVQNPEIKLNLYILISANFKGKDRYLTGLKYISSVIGLFQSKNVFNHQNTPGLDDRIEKLILDLYTLSFEQQNYLWGAVGSKLLTSVMYKVRLIVIQEELTSANALPIQQIVISQKKV